MSDPVYLTRPIHPNQAKCRHRLRNVPRTQCCQCGSRKNELGVWEYLNATWFAYFLYGGARPRD
jgi:hypothetical protein